jgi:hypothetical protein
LKDAGKVSHEVARELAEKEYERYVSFKIECSKVILTDYKTDYTAKKEH